MDVRDRADERECLERINGSALIVEMSLHLGNITMTGNNHGREACGDLARKPDARMI
jgi:hypothetical protein